MKLLEKESATFFKPPNLIETTQVLNVEQNVEHFASLSAGCESQQKPHSSTKAGNKNHYQLSIVSKDEGDSFHLLRRPRNSTPPP